MFYWIKYPRRFLNIEDSRQEIKKEQHRSRFNLFWRCDIITKKQSINLHQGNLTLIKQ